MAFGDQKVNVNLYLYVTLFFAMVCVIISGYFYLQNQELRSQNAALSSEITEVRLDEDDWERFSETNRNREDKLLDQLNNLEQNYSRIKTIYDNYVVAANFRQNTPGNRQNVVEITSYGREETTDILGVCEGERRNVDQLTELSFSLDDIGPESKEYVDVNGNKDELASLENVRCEITQCSENCIPGGTKLEG